MKELTDRSKLFCEEYIKNWYHARNAYKTVYGQEDDQKASVSAYQLLKDQRVQDYIDIVEWTFRIAWYKAWISKDAIVRILFDMLHATKKDAKWNDVPDWTARHNAILDFARLTGDLNEKKKVEVPNDEFSDEKLKYLTFTELIEKREKILKSL